MLLVEVCTIRGLLVLNFFDRLAITMYFKLTQKCNLNIYFDDGVVVVVVNYMIFFTSGVRGMQLVVWRRFQRLHVLQQRVRETALNI